MLTVFLGKGNMMTKSLRRCLGALVGLAAAGVAQSAVQISSSSAITQLVSYTAYGSGDWVFSLASSGLAGCSTGFWVRGTDSGAKATIAQLLAAYHSGTPVVVYADSTVIWPGSGGSYC